MNLQVVWGTTPKKKNLHDAGLYPELNAQSHFDFSNWFSEDQLDDLKKLTEELNSNGDQPFIEGYQIVRGAFHGKFTRLRILTENWGKDMEDTYRKVCELVANAVGWHFVFVDGAKAIIKQDCTTDYLENTKSRWHLNNPHNHQLESAQKNWNTYHEFIGDLEELGEFDLDKFHKSGY